MSALNLKTTPLHASHLDLSARMVPFSGWNMPVQYQKGILSEHTHTRNSVSVFDTCHMGEFRISGKGCAESIDGILARKVLDQKNGTCRYNFLLTDEGAVIDDLLVYRMDDEEFFLVVNAGTKDGDAERIRALLGEGSDFSDLSEATGKIDVQGPLTMDVMEKIGFSSMTLPAYYRFIRTKIDGKECILSRTGYTGELGFEIYTDSKDTESVWKMLLDIPEVEPAGLGARDTLRLEMGYPLYGHELDTSTTPVEAGFGKMLENGLDRQSPGLERLRNSQPRKILFGILLEGRRAARRNASVRVENRKIGKVSSGTFSPSLEKAVALAYIDAGTALEEGNNVLLEAGRALVPGKICPLPFYKNGTARKKF